MYDYLRFDFHQFYKITIYDLSKYNRNEVSHVKIFNFCKKYSTCLNPAIYTEVVVDKRFIVENLESFGNFI